MKDARRAIYVAATVLLVAGGCVASNGAATPVPTGAITQPVSAQSPTLEALPSPTAATQPTAFLPDLFFDDFNYVSLDEMRANSWIIRSQAGWPGVPGAAFRPENVSFVEDATPPGNILLRMTSSTDGSSERTLQTQICHERKYLEGTYAARVHFRDAPTVGPDGDQVVEAFYAITPYRQALDPNYSEMDFEYLPNGGWDWQPTTLMFTTWETVRIEPWLGDNTYNSIQERQEGWRTLVVQVMNGSVRYYISGKLGAEHTGSYYPDSAMSINFNLWFINGGLLPSRELRSYQLDIDWVFHQKGALLTPEQVNRQVRLLRESGMHSIDSVLEMSPPLESPCDL